MRSRRAERERVSGAVAAATFAAAGALLAGCAAKQAIPLDCVTEEVVVYVDGRLLAEDPNLLELSTDEPHKLYFKRPGFEPQLVVLDPGVDADGRRTLEPRDVCAELRPIGLDRELTIEVDQDAPN
jgi:hypothetical protein